MTTLTTSLQDTASASDDRHISVFGVPWPMHKLAAVLGAIVVAVTVFSFTGSGAAAMWSSGGVVLAIWWGGYRLLHRRWDDGERDFYAENRAGF